MCPSCCPQSGVNLASRSISPSRSISKTPAQSDFPLTLSSLQVARELVGRLGLTRSRNAFALYEQRGAQERALAGGTLVADVLTRFEK